MKLKMGNVTIEKSICYSCKTEQEHHKINIKYSFDFCKNYCDLGFTTNYKNNHVCKEFLVVKKGNTVRNQCVDCGTLVGRQLKKKDYNFEYLQSYENLNVINETIENGAKVLQEARIRYQSKSLQKKQEKKDKFWIDYNLYLQSSKWKDKRLKVLKRDNYICQSCLFSKATQVHHLTYENVFNENCFELTSVCKPCHENIHQ